MVLVSDKPTKYVSMLQTKFSDREGHEARRVGLEAMPLDQHIEGGHGEREPRLKIRPHAVHDPLAMADHGQHGEHRLNKQAVLPLAALTQFEVGGIALGGMEAGITEDNHALLKLPNQPLKGVIRDIGGVTRPRHHQAVLVQQQTEFAADNPAMIREAFAADLPGAAAFAYGMDQLYPIRVDDPEHRRRGQEGLRPVLMRLEEAKEPRPLRYVREQRAIILRQPAIERPVTPAFERMQQPQGDDLAGPEVGVGVFGDAWQMVIDLTEQRGDKLYG